MAGSDIALAKSIEIEIETVEGINKSDHNIRAVPRQPSNKRFTASQLETTNLAPPTTTLNAMTSSKPLVIIVTGSDSGFGLMSARSLAMAGHIVYGGLFRPEDGTYPNYQAFANLSKEHNCNLRGIHLDVVKDDIIGKAVSRITQDEGRIDAIVHNAGHMSLGPTEAFTPDQFAEMYDTNCISCHRLNRAVLPLMRKQRSGLLIWVSSSSAHGPSSPFLGAYFAARAAQDSLAQTTALEVSQFGIETCIVSPSIFTSGTNHFGSAMKPEDKDVEKEYEEGPTQ